MLRQNLGALCEPAGGPGSLMKYLEALVRVAKKSGKFGSRFWTDLHFAHVGKVHSAN